jgi:glycosyltransferase involved in cell wall biosynthesis
MKILIVTMYFPPTGGGGAQRPSNLASHLPSLGVETHVLTPRDPKWIQQNGPTPPSAGVRVHRVRNLGPRTRLRGRELAGVRGGRRLLGEIGLLPRRVLVPDAQIVWALAAVPAALRIIRRHEIDVVLTTSPPVSLHLVGALSSCLARARWIADLRDPLVSSAYRRAEVRGERAVARLVAAQADALTTATHSAADEMRRLGRANGIAVIPNGCDLEDFDGLTYRRGTRFTITHTGSFLSHHRDPRPFFQALRRSGSDSVARFVGDLRPSDLAYAREIGLGERVQSLPFVPRRQALALQRESDALLLLIPEADGRGKAVVTAKLCEYVAARRPILAAIPIDGEAAGVLRQTGAAAIVAPDDVDGMAAALTAFERRWDAGVLSVPPTQADIRASLSGRAVAEGVADVLRSLPPAAPRVEKRRSPR